MIKPQVLIVTADPRLSDVLCMHAALCGMEAIAARELSALPEQVLQGACAMVLDLDEKPSVSLPAQVRVLGLCRDPEALPLRTRRAASIVLRRPFSMADFRRELTFAAALHDRQGQAPTAWGEQAAPAVKLLPGSRSALVEGEQIPLTQKEYDLLALLLACGEVGASIQQIDQCIGKGSANQGQVYICHLRKKLERTPGVRRIQTVRGWGYRLI